MNAFHEAYNLADTLLNREDLDLESLTRKYCPVALGQQNNGFLIPSDLCVPSVFARQYFSSLLLQDMRGLRLLLKLLQDIRDTNGITLSSINDYALFQYMASSFCPQGLSSFTIPIVEMRGGLTRREAFARQVSIQEYMALHEFQFVSSVFNHVIQIVLFGFPITFEIAELFDLDAGAYLPSRLFEGAGDVLMGGMNVITNFAPFEAFTMENPELTQSLVNFASASKVDRKKRELLNIQSMMQGTYFLGPNSEMVVALARSDMFDEDNAYNSYLKTNTGMAKLGYPVWMKLAHARRLDDDSKIQMSVQNFAGADSAVSQANYTGAEINVTLMF